jgi:hypothetical protein
VPHSNPDGGRYAVVAGSFLLASISRTRGQADASVHAQRVTDLGTGAVAMRAIARGAIGVAWATRLERGCSEGLETCRRLVALQRLVWIGAWRSGSLEDLHRITLWGPQVSTDTVLRAAASLRSERIAAIGARDLGTQSTHQPAAVAGAAPWQSRLVSAWCGS